MAACQTGSFILLACLIGTSMQVLGARVRREEDKTYIVTSIEESPFLQDGDGDDQFKGYIPDLVKKLAEKVDFEYELRTVSDGTYGSSSSNGDKWTGMIGELVKKNADIAAGPITISAAREEVVDFTKPFMSMGITLLVKKPTTDEARAKVPKRVVDLANSTASLTYGLVRGGRTETFFKSSEDANYKKIFDNIGERFRLTTITEGVDRVRNENGNFVFIIESPMADYWINQEPCDLIKIDDTINLGAYAIATQKGSELKDKLSEAILALQEEGDLLELEKKWWPRTCNETTEVGAASSNNAHVVVFVGMAVLVALLQQQH